MSDSESTRSQSPAARADRRLWSLRIRWLQRHGLTESPAATIAQVARSRREVADAKVNRDAAEADAAVQAADAAAAAAYDAASSTASSSTTAAAAAAASSSAPRIFLATSKAHPRRRPPAASES